MNSPEIAYINAIKQALGCLDLPPNSPLKQDALALCDYWQNPAFRIAVFGPFNYGKSTLLNALLGDRTLPIDLIPTTGAAIQVCYGAELSTEITLKNGQVIQQSGTEGLKQFAILDDDRQMRSDVAGVRVFCPHPFLKTGVELLDLPGTNDREEQDQLVRDRLLTSDLIIQVLDGRKLMTLGERENLRDWLLDRGIKTVVFVVNFLNLLSEEDQKQVYNRLRFVAESFRSDLPPNVSNLYRVDALPALRARLKGDGAAVQTTGLPIFQTALQTIVGMQQGKTENRLPRIHAIARQIQTLLIDQKNTIHQQIKLEESKHQSKIEIKQKAQKIIQQGFDSAVAELENWLYLPNLQQTYQRDISLALEQGSFQTWEEVKIKPKLQQYRQEVVSWVQKACDFFNHPQRYELALTLPSQPQVVLPQPPKAGRLDSLKEIAPVPLSTGLGWLVGGPVGAVVIGGASYLFNQIGQDLLGESNNSEVSYAESVQLAYETAALDYLGRFSSHALLSLRQYVNLVEAILNNIGREEPIIHPPNYHQLQLLNTLIEQLRELH